MKSKVFTITPVDALFQNRDPFYEVIKDKIPGYAEIVVNLFDHCNMRCVFCPQDHTDRTGASREEIMSKVPLIAGYINSNPSSAFHLHVMGGELLQDEFVDLGFLTYYTEFMAALRAAVTADKELVFNYVTNLVFDRTNEVKQFAIDNDLKFAVSYDPTGRFNAEQFITFKRNVEIFKDHIRVIGLTMSKPSMDKMHVGDKYFDYLYDNFLCDWDHLLPSGIERDVMMPAESDLLAFYKLLIDKYPKCLNVEHFVADPKDSDGTHSTMPCTRGNNLTIFSDNSIPHGCSGTIILRNNTTEVVGNTDIIHKFLDKNDCLHCEYYKRCAFTCFVHNDYKDFVRDVQGCVFKESFKYAEQKRSGDKKMTPNWMNDFLTKGYARFSEPDLADLIDVDNFKMAYTKEMLRDNGREDLPTHVIKQLDTAAFALKEKYVDKAFPENDFVKFIIWEGVDADSALWHTDCFEGMNAFFLLYFDDMKEETGGAVHFKHGDTEETFYPKRGDLFFLNQSPGFFHRAEKATIPRRQASFDFMVSGL